MLNKKRDAIPKMKFKTKPSLKGYTNMKLQPIKKGVISDKTAKLHTC